eukprot:12231.XXX_27512_26322_1 [CDS] Oithona nana genome sequencing.
MAAMIENGHNGEQFKEDSDEDVSEPQKEVDITINNVVSSFNVRCHLNLVHIAQNGLNVEYRRENGMVTMKIRKPYTTANIWSSGKITCTGANSEENARIAARKFARILQKLEYNTRIRNYRVVNVLGTVTLPFAIRITQFSQAYPDRASYEPELHPGVTFKIKDPKATLKVFSTGSITVTAPSVANVQRAVEHIYPLVEEFQKAKTANDIKDPIPKTPEQTKGQKRPKSSPALASSSKSSKNGQGSYVYVAKKPALKPDSDSSDEDNVSDESLDSD